MRRFDLLFDDSPADRATGIAERVRCQRVTRLMQAWQRHRERKESFGRLSAAVAFFRGLEAIAQEAGNGVLEFIDRWPVSYFVSRNYEDDGKEELAYGRLATDLLCSKLPNGASPLAGLTFATPLERDGSLLVLGRGGRLLIDGLRNSGGCLVWSCSANKANITDVSDALGGVEIELPLQASDAPFARFSRNAVANGFEIPILDHGAEVLLTRGYSPDREDTSPSDSAAIEKPLSVSDSLSMAHAALAAVWPEVIPWARALVPAVADMGPREAGSPRLSGSFGPGEPIYLTQVSNPLLHAEDLIHEVQHLRFALAVRAEDWFGRWNEQEQTFISPYRPDPRPIAGIHIGLHAFVAVTELGLRMIDQPYLGQVSLNWLYDTHLRNLFAFHTIAKHERLSNDGKSYYRELGRALADQHSRIGGILRPAQREQILSSLNWPIRPVSEVNTAENASIDIHQVASIDEIVELIPLDFGA